ncbi:hypothetical protein ABC365_14965 [Brevundimonas sp. 3P9-tot-E]|uniref:hypothetical protein n=1 Tax=Brevundimonas TaxID=41275 RepID=UPI0034D50F00
MTQLVGRAAKVQRILLLIFRSLKLAYGSLWRAFFIGGCMAVLVLPSVPAPAGVGVELLTNRNVLVSAQGGEQERQRKDSRCALTFPMPPMSASLQWRGMI